MIVLKIDSVKEYMTGLFQGNMFDHFQIRNCEVRTFTNFICDGINYEEWYDTDDKNEQDSVYWKQIKPIIFSLIKGKKTPLRLSIEFFHVLQTGDVGAIRIQYEHDELLVYTGYMQKEFSLDRSSQELWDEKCEKFLHKNEIVSTRLD